LLWKVQYVKLAKFLSCLEISFEQDVVFLGGADYPKNSPGVGFLYALTFDSNLHVIECHQFTKEKNITGISCMRRHEAGNVLFVGCNESILVIVWTELRFFVVQRIPNNSLNPVLDLAFQEGLLYSVSDHHIGMVVHFSDRLVAHRSEVLRPKEQARHLLLNQQTSKRGLRLERPGQNTEFISQDKAEEEPVQVVDDEVLQEELRKNALREVMLKRLKVEEEEGSAKDTFKLTLPENCRFGVTKAMRIGCQCRRTTSIW
jgi:hypothetical protein